MSKASIEYSKGKFWLAFFVAPLLSAIVATTMMLTLDFVFSAGQSGFPDMDTAIAIVFVLALGFYLQEVIIILPILFWLLRSMKGLRTTRRLIIIGHGLISAVFGVMFAFYLGDSENFSEEDYALGVTILSVISAFFLAVIGIIAGWIFTKIAFHGARDIAYLAPDQTSEIFE